MWIRKMTKARREVGEAYSDRRAVWKTGSGEKESGTQGDHSWKRELGHEPSKTYTHLKAKRTAWGNKLLYGTWSRRA